MSGPANATTDETGLRRYVWKGQELVSVTSLRRIVGMPFELAAWQVNQVLDASITLKDNFEALPDESDPTYDAAVAALKTALRREAMAKRDRAANLGTDVHLAAANEVEVNDAEPEVQPFLKQFYDAAEKLLLDVRVSEAQVWNLKLGYAGSLDFIGEITPQGMATHIALGDIKTGSGVYLDHVLQLCAYCSAEFIGKNDVIDREATDWLHRVDTLGVLHLRPDHWEWLEIEPADPSFLAFRRMAGLANWLDQYRDVERHITTRVTGAA